MNSHFPGEKWNNASLLVHNPMKNLQNLVLKLAQAHPNAPLHPAAETLLRDRLDRFVSDYRTPEHPPYSAMIENALQGLNEQAGSTKKSISQYLEKKYDNLPLAHSVLLKHHLEKACKRGEITVTRSKKYRVAGSLSPSPKVKRKPRQRKWRWECKRQKHDQLKIRLIKKRNNQKGEGVEAVEKHQECDKVQPLTENGVHGEHNQDQIKSLLSCVGEKKCCEEARSQQEIDPSAIEKADISAAHTPEHQEREQSEHEQPKPSTPERPPGFESVIIEHLHQLGSTGPEPEPDVVEVLNGNEKSKLPAVLQNGHGFEPYMTIDSLESALSTEHEPQELLQEPPTKNEEIFQVKQLRRSPRTPAKPQLAQDASIIIALPVTVCRCEGMLLKQRPRSWPPSKSMKAASVDELQDSPKSQKHRMQLRQKPVKNLQVVADSREQELEQSGKVSECASMHEKMDVLPPDNSKPHLKKALKEQRLGRPPQRRSARLLKQR